jgi:hypothetical protein
MRLFCALCGLLLAVAIVSCSPVVKRDTEEGLKELDPLNEVYVLEVDDDAPDGEKSDREKRKIGVTLGVTNGVLSFVFGKLDSFLDAKTRALAVLDESNKAKNAAFGIDPNQSATSQFISNLVSQKIRAATGSIGPLISGATTLVSGAASGLTNTLATKIAPLSSLSGGSLSGGASGGAGAGGTTGDSGSPGGSAILGNLLTVGINTLSTLSQSSGGTSGGSAGGGTSSGSSGTGASAGAGLNLGGFANIGGFGR